MEKKYAETPTLYYVSGLDKGRCADTDVYKMHDSLDDAKSCVFMVTNVRVLYASYNQVNQA